MDELPDDRPDEDYPDNDYRIPMRPMDGPSTSSSTPMKTSSGTIKDLECATKRLKIEQLYKFLDVEGDANTLDIERFKVTRNTKNKSYNAVLLQRRWR